MTRRAVTSVDVAKRAGVSQSAVSRVFTPGRSASAQTAEKVRKAAAELGYTPNPLARAMITGKSRIIGLVVAYLDNQFYPMALEKLSHALQDQGYHILIFMVGNDTARIPQILDEMLAYKVDGIITASVAISNEIGKRVEARGIPVVMFNRGQDDSTTTAVQCDNVAGSHMATTYLIQSGHRRIAHVAGWQGASTGRDRSRGFAQAMAQADLTPLWEVEGAYDRDRAIALTRTALAQHGVPDGIIVGNDHMAFAVMDTLRTDHGLRIPEDVSVIGFDDVPIAGWPAYDLTTVRQPVDRMVTLTVAQIISLIENQDTPSPAPILPELIVRGSTRKPQGASHARV